ncbi:hypothetical protein B5K11_05620 [Rhizobium leguminosarum bv. trifolii]|nr:hypothetical protein B5K11_05620 [Rhizobium leguminosarum bv. trifolii]
MSRKSVQRFSQAKREALLPNDMRKNKTPCRAKVCSGFPRQSAKRFCGNDMRKNKKLKRDAL